MDWGRALVLIAQEGGASKGISDSLLQTGAVGAFLLICLGTIGTLGRWLKQIFDDMKKSRDDLALALSERVKFSEEVMVPALVKNNEILREILEQQRRRALLAEDEDRRRRRDQ